MTRQLDLETVQDRLHLLSGYVMELKGKGLFLSHEEEEVLIYWVNSSPHLDIILQVVDEQLPKLYENFNQSLPPPITKVKESIAQKIRGLSALRS